MTVETLVPECKIYIEIIMHQKCICCCCTGVKDISTTSENHPQSQSPHLIFSQSTNPGNNFNVDPLNQSLSKVGLLLSLVSVSFSIWSVAAVLVPLWASSEQYKTPLLAVWAHRHPADGVWLIRIHSVSAFRLATQHLPDNPQFNGAKNSAPDNPRLDKRAKHLLDSGKSVLSSIHFAKMGFLERIRRSLWKAEYWTFSDGPAYLTK